MRVVFDENISYRLVEVLRLLGEADLEHVVESFPPGTPDVDILVSFRDADVLYVTADLKNRTRPIERIVIRSSSARVVVLGRFFSKLTLFDKAAWLLKHWRSLRANGEVLRIGQIKEIRPGGKLI
ncbi:MAG: DUF5615 family PIN-like protein [Planctomycetota bacterium]